MKGDLVSSIDWQKGQGMVPVIVQDAHRLTVLMLGMMTPEALLHTERTGLVTFYSRSKQRLWTKGESSGSYLKVVSMHVDCDRDALLVKADPQGPTCHRQTTSCFDDEAKALDEGLGFLLELEGIIAARLKQPTPQSYTARLMAEGMTRLAQKVGEEGLEVALAAATGERQQLLEESADLMFHWLLLLNAQGASLFDVIRVLKRRHQQAR